MATLLDALSACAMCLPATTTDIIMLSTAKSKMAGAAAAAATAADADADGFVACLSQTFVA